jgi:hypothetical protein
MNALLNKEKPEVRLRAFRAIDDPETCALFLHGHEQVLTSIGVHKVTSSRNEWMSNPASFVLIVESLDKSKVYGGARVHVSGGSEPLPIELATRSMDSAILDVVRAYARFGTGEVCGLWNSREIAGYGIGSIFLFRAAVAIATQIGLHSLFGLCAPYTLKMAENVGFEVIHQVGNDGTFYYPKIDLLATAVLLEDLENMSTAHDEDRNAILKLRNNLNVVVLEELRKKRMMIHYEIKIPNLETWDLKATIANAERQFNQVHIDEADLNFL